MHNEQRRRVRCAKSQDPVAASSGSTCMLTDPDQNSMRVKSKNEPAELVNETLAGDSLEGIDVDAALSGLEVAHLSKPELPSLEGRSPRWRFPETGSQAASASLKLDLERDEVVNLFNWRTEIVDGISVAEPPVVPLIPNFADQVSIINASVENTSRAIWDANNESAISPQIVGVPCQGFVPLPTPETESLARTRLIESPVKRESNVDQFSLIDAAVAKVVRAMRDSYKKNIESLMSPPIVGAPCQRFVPLPTPKTESLAPTHLIESPAKRARTGMPNNTDPELFDAGLNLPSNLNYTYDLQDDFFNVEPSQLPQDLHPDLRNAFEESVRNYTSMHTYMHGLPHLAIFSTQRPDGGVG